MTSGTTHPHAFVFHGYGATPDDHWFGWLADRLRADGISTSVPMLPDPLDPDPSGWENVVRVALTTPDEHSIVVAHSLGCLTVLRYLRALQDPWRLGVLVLVSGFVDRLPALPELDAYLGDGCNVTGFGGHIDRLVVIRRPDQGDDLRGHGDRDHQALPRLHPHR